jgi:hypothetical protein
MSMTQYKEVFTRRKERNRRPVLFLKEKHLGLKKVPGWVGGPINSVFRLPPISMVPHTGLYIINKYLYQHIDKQPLRKWAQEITAFKKIFYYTRVNSCSDCVHLSTTDFFSDIDCCLISHNKDLLFLMIQ